MIFDKRLKLAENFDVTTSRTTSGIKQSDLFPILEMGNIGQGEQLFCCVTIRETFNVPLGNPIYIKMSLREELYAYTGLIDTVIRPTFGADAARHAHNRNQILASTGYIELAPDVSGTSNNSANNNFVAGKKFTFAINPYSGSVNASAFDGVATQIVKKFQGGTYAYFLFEEFTSGILDTSFTPDDVLTSGKVDVEIVSLADSGAGAGFSDVKAYPIRTIVR